MWIKLLALTGSIFLILFFQNCNQFKSINSDTQNSSEIHSMDPKMIIGAEIPSALATNAYSSSETVGLKGDCKTDDTAALQNFFNKGGILKKPIGGCYLITDTIFIPSNIQVQGEGLETLIKLEVPAGSAARPVLDFSGSGNRTTVNIHISNLSIDAGGSQMAMPAKYNGNIGYGAAIVVQSSNSSVKDIKIKNAWDTGVVFYQLGCIDGGPGQQCNSYPKNVTALRVVCENNGIGKGSHFLGSCVGALTSQNTLIADSTDYGSAVGFHLDFGGAAQASFKNLKAYNNRLVGYWIGSVNGYFENIEAYNTIGDHRLGNPIAGHGLVLDRFASARGDFGSIPQIGYIKNFKSTGARKSGILVAASGWKIENPTIVSSNQSGQGYSAITGLGDNMQITGLSMGVSNTEILNPIVKNLPEYLHQPEYGYHEMINEGSCLSIRITGGSISGLKGSFSPQVGSRPCSDQKVDLKVIENMIIQIFQEVLKRAPQAAGLDHYVKEFLKGKSMVEIRESISSSPEAVCINSKGQFSISSLSCSCPSQMVLSQNRCVERSLTYEEIVRKAFIDILKREPLQAGLEYYVGLLKSGASEQSIRNEIGSSAEGQCVKLNKVFVNGQCY